MIQTPEAVKTLRLAAGLTQVELCQLTSISPIDTNEEEHMTIMTRMKALRLAAGLTQQELSVATGIYPGKITDVERDIRALNKDQWDRIQLVCDDRIKMFKRDAGRYD